MTGTAMRNTEPHQKKCSSRPPSAGPSAAPAEKLITQTPIAAVRCRSSRNILRISESVEGASVEAAIPSSPRATMSIATLVAKAASTEASPNIAAPIISSRRRPMRSPTMPMVSRKPASRKP